MPRRIPTLHPVTEILDSLLTLATASAVPELKPTPIVDLSAISDDELTIVRDSRSAPDSQEDDDDDDDDDIEIVSAAIIAPPNPINVDVAESVYPILADRDPHPPELTSAVIDIEADGGCVELGDVKGLVPVLVDDVEDVDAVRVEDEVIECHAPPRRPRSTAGCGVCKMPFTAAADHRVSISRCKHVLCAKCSLEAVQDGEGMGGLKAVPVCIVDRCRAPLSVDEVEMALAGKEVDLWFEPWYNSFSEWKEGALGDEIGGKLIEFPSFSVEFSSVAREGGLFDGIELLLTDDVATACEPLWMFNHHAWGGNGMWMCAACGELENSGEKGSGVGSGDAAVMVIDDDCRVVDEVEVVSSSDMPEAPPPTYPHCAYARALGLSENIKGLERVWEDEEAAARRKREEQKAKDKKTKAPEKKAKKESSGEGKRRSSRKRYLTAATIWSHKRRKSAKKTGFAKGTGYAGSSGGEWKGTSEELLEETQKLDAEATYWLIRIRCFLLRLGEDGQLATWPGFMRFLLRDCRLVAHLAKILINESMMDVLGRIPVFYAALRVVHALTELPSLRVLVTEPSDGDNGRCIAELVESMSRQAAVLSSGAGPEGLPESTAFLIKQIRKCIRGINRHNLLQIARNRGTVPCPVLDDENTADNFTVGDAVKGDETLMGMDVRSGAAASGTISFEADKVAYIENMRAHQFEAVPGLAESSSFYRDASQVASQSVNQGKRQRRIASEVASLCSSLPLSWSSTILLRVDEDRYDFLRACIFGPEDTPYDSGAFLFDIYLPPQYPYVPPKFRLLTTGSGRVRFNPNLYSNGKVCLSLLGTWSGPSWTSASTILQVLVSIQSLILVPDPYFNEPGFERSVGTEIGKRSSDKYNERVQLNCAIHAIQYNIRHPMTELESGIRAHFRLKRRYITHNLKNWFARAVGSTQSHNNSSGDGVKTEGKSKAGASGGGEKATALSVDPSLFGLTVGNIASVQFFQSNGAGSAAMSSFGPGRNYRAPEMTVSLLESILNELNAVGC